MTNEFKKLINQKKRLWNSIIRKRFQLSDSNQMLINYKLLKRNVRLKFKKELKDYEWNVATNFKLHPKMYYKWVSTKSRNDPDLGYIKIWFGSFLDHHQKKCLPKVTLIQMTPMDYPLELNKQSKTLSHQISGTTGLFHL